MKREFKFRVYSTYEKRMIYDELMQYISFNDDGYINNHAMIGETIVMQYIGLKDANGNEIYEGDVIQSLPKGFEPRNKYEIIWYNPESKYEMRCGDDITSLYLKNMVVIGNIYENANLLT